MCFRLNDVDSKPWRGLEGVVSRYWGRIALQACVEWQCRRSIDFVIGREPPLQFIQSSRGSGSSLHGCFSELAIAYLHTCKDSFVHGDLASARAPPGVYAVHDWSTVIMLLTCIGTTPAITADRPADTGPALGLKGGGSAAAVAKKRSVRTVAPLVQTGPTTDFPLRWRIAM
jgi:hypothetical protein